MQDLDADIDIFLFPHKDSEPHEILKGKMIACVLSVLVTQQETLAPQSSENQRRV